MNPTRLLPVVLIGLSTVIYTTDRVEAADKPNIVFIMADDLGTGHLGFNGQEKINTPNIDQMRREGLYFNQVYAGCAVCAPCRSVLMTGYHMGDWKAVQMDPRQPIELFNLRTDESETADMADMHPEVMARIKEYLATCRTEPRPQVEPEGTGDWRFR